MLGQVIHHVPDIAVGDLLVMSEGAQLPKISPLSASENVSFRTRARTIDHLGRGQIADAPTAVSELWKNAWDAYATQVSLNIFEGDPVVAAVFDDGIGMSADDFVNKWLVIGTEFENRWSAAAAASRLPRSCSRAPRRKGNRPTVSCLPCASHARPVSPGGGADFCCAS